MDNDKVKWDGINWEDVHKETHVIFNVGVSGASGCSGVTGLVVNGKEVKTEEEFQNIKRKDRLDDILGEEI